MKTSETEKNVDVVTSKMAKAYRRKQMKEMQNNLEWNFELKRKKIIYLVHSEWRWNFFTAKSF